jgi:fumarate hydratase subunit beta
VFFLENMRNIEVKDLKEQAKKLKAGERIQLSGYIYTARDAAHKRLIALMEEGLALPFDIKDSVIYYAGPTPAKEGLAVGSCGPTTSGRMDVYAPRLMEAGLLGMIGKGERDDKVCEAICQHQGIYLCAIGGAGALASKSIKTCEIIAFPELGCESIKRFYIKDFPLIVAIDSSGGNLFKEGRKKYKINHKQGDKQGDGSSV